MSRTLLARAKAFIGYIQGETLSTEVYEGSIPDGLSKSADDFDGQHLEIALRKA